MKKSEEKFRANDTKDKMSETEKVKRKPYENIIPEVIWREIKDKKVVVADWAAGPGYVVRKQRKYDAPVAIEEAFKWLDKDRAVYRACSIVFEDRSVLWLYPSEFMRYDVDDREFTDSGMKIHTVDGNTVKIQADMNSAIKIIDSKKQGDKDAD